MQLLINQVTLLIFVFIWYIYVSLHLCNIHQLSKYVIHHRIPHIINLYIYGVKSDEFLVNELLHECAFFILLLIYAML